MRGLVAITNDRRDGAIVPSGSSAQVLLGHGHIVEELAGVSIAVGAAEFLQVNRAQAAAMYARVAELALDARRQARGRSVRGARRHRPAPRARGRDVVSVEIDREAVAQLRRAAERAELAAARARRRCGRIAGGAARQLGEADIVVVNPPRKGLSEGALTLLVELAAPTIVYVSCGPESLGRDLVALARTATTPDVVEPFDLMPGTAQVETVVRLRRRTPAA